MKNCPFWIVGAHAWLAIGYSIFGREEEARYHVAEGLKADPNWSLEMEGKIYSYKNPADLERQVATDPPCHRSIPHTGGVDGYRWDIKRI